MDTTIHINVADIPPEVGESFGRVALPIRLPARLAKKGSVRNDPDSDDRVRHHRRTGSSSCPGGAVCCDLCYRSPVCLAGQHGDVR